MRYEYGWCSKCLIADATTIEEMINTLQDLADMLREMKARGVTLDPDSVDNAYATLVTDDPKVAAEFGFEPPEEDDDADCN
jgi:hypothetical protein